jgi:hypothetical protein
VDISENPLPPVFFLETDSESSLRGRLKGSTKERILILSSLGLNLIRAATCDVQTYKNVGTIKKRN